MQRLEGVVRRQLVNILLLFLVGAFVMLVAELLLTNHVDGIQNVAVIASIVGAVAALAGFFVKGTLRHLVVLVMVVLSLSGLLGAWEHLESREGGEARASSVRMADANASSYQLAAYQAAPLQQEENEEKENGERNEAGANEREGGEREGGEREGGEREGGEREGGEGGEGAPPPLAPLSLSGLALMGAVVLMAKQDN